MTLFGTTLDGQQLMSLVSLLLVLVFWIMVMKRQRQGDRALKRTLQDLYPPAEPKPKDTASDRPPRGPWG